MWMDWRRCNEMYHAKCQSYFLRIIPVESGERIVWQSNCPCQALQTRTRNSTPGSIPLYRRTTSRLSKRESSYSSRSPECKSSERADLMIIEDCPNHREVNQSNHTSLGRCSKQGHVNCHQPEQCNSRIFSPLPRPRDDNTNVLSSTPGCSHRY